MFIDRLRTKSVSILIVASLLLLAVAWWSGDRRTHALWVTTATLAAGTALLALPAGTWLGFLIARTDLPGRRALALLLGFLLIVPLYLQAGAWQAGFGLQGWVTFQLGAMPWLDGLSGVIWIHAMSATAWVALIVGVGLRWVEPELEEAALLVGSPWQVVRTVTLRRAASMAGIAFLWIGILTAGEMTVTDLFRVRTYAEEVYMAYAATGDMEVVALELLPAIAMTGLLLLLGLGFCLALAPTVRSVGHRRPHRFTLGAWRWPCAVLSWALLAVLAAVPFGNLVYKAGLQVSQAADGSVVRAWNVGKLFHMVFVDSVEQFGQEFATSMAVGMISATMVLATAVGLAWFARRGGWRTGVVLAITAGSLALPGPLIGAFVARVLVRVPWIYDSLLAPCAAIWIRTLPLAALVVWIAFRSIPIQAFESAAVEGARPRTQLIRIAIPMRWPSLVAAWLLGFVLAIGDLSASQLLLVPGQETVANRVFDRLHSGADDQVAGLLLAMLLFFSVVAVLLLRLTSRRS